MKSGDCANSDMMMFINGESEEESEHEWIRRAGEVLDKVTTYNLTDLLHFLVPKQLQVSRYVGNATVIFI